MGVGSGFSGGSYVVLHDPALFEHDSLEAGWFFGRKDRDYVKELVPLIERIASALRLSSSDIFFYGGSAGGFSSFHFGACLPGSRVIADIPRIDMRTYPVVSAAEAACEVAFATPDYHLLPVDLLCRVDVIERFKAQKVVPEFLYLQDINDRGHFRSQFSYFMDKLLELQFHFEWARTPFQVEVYDQKIFLRGTCSAQSRGHAKQGKQVLRTDSRQQP